MTDSETQKTLREFLMREFPKHARALGSASVDDSLVDLGILDSLGLLTLVTFVELKYGVKIRPKDFTAESFKSLRSIETTLERSR